MEIRINAITYIILVLPLLSFAQDKHDYNWQLGPKSNPLTNPFPTSLEMNFNMDTLIITPFYRPMKMGYFNASISTSNGDLLLYSNGCFINNGNHEYISDSENLNPGSIDAEWCDQPPGDYPIADGGLFLSFKEDSVILLLHQRQVVEGPPLKIFVDALFYTSLIKEGGSYSILEKSIPILEDSLSEGRLEAIEGIRPGYWWIIQGKRNSNMYYTIGIENGQIDTTFVQTIGDTTIKRGEAAAQSVFSPDATKYARYSPADDLFIFDFDRSSGLLSNYTKIHVADSGLIGGLAFSSNSQFLYANTNLDLYQFDILSNNLQKSKIHIAHYDGFASPFPTTFYHMQLGPDCKIYMIPPNGANSMHVINEPNKLGIDCNFKQHSLELPYYNTITLPNFPVFRSFAKNFCDPIQSTNLNFSIKSEDVSIFPNPFIDVLNLQILNNNSASNSANISIYNSYGIKLFSSKYELYRHTLYLPVSGFPSGLYYLSIEMANLIHVEKIIKL